MRGSQLLIREVHAWAGRQAPLVRVVATRDIAAGAEVTIAYADVMGRDVKERRQMLREAFAFSCACEACVAEGGPAPPLKADGSRLAVSLGDEAETSIAVNLIQ